MPTFEQFLLGTYNTGQAANLMFEERYFGLIEILHRVSEMFANEQIPYELIGGMAVAAQIDRVDRDPVMLTRNVDVMIARSDLERVKEAAERYGFHFRHGAGLDMLLFGNEKKAINGVHLLYCGEQVKLGQAPNPEMGPERFSLYGKEVSVIPVGDLVRMKLNSFRDKDRVHIRAMDGLGLITPEIERGLSVILSSRLEHIRNTD